MNTSYYIVAAFFSIFIQNYATADELHLKNGDRITGQVLELSTTRCLFKTDYQATLHINRSDIVRLNIIQAGDDAVPFSAMTDGQLSKALGKAAEKTAPKKKSEPSAVLGEEPDEDLRQIFLRQSTVLLKPGEKELDVSLSYTRDEFANLRVRQWNLPLSLRMGIRERLEGFVNVPIIWAQRQVFYQDSINKNDAAGIGDVGAGLKYLLKQQDSQWPDMIASLSFIAPTGDRSDPKNPDDLSVGGGHWHLSTGLTLVKSYDPAVLFGGIGYTRTLKETINGVETAPGNRFNYSFGMGFAINTQITMSGQFLGAYQSKSAWDGAKIPGSSREPMSLRTGLTYRMSKGRYLEPAVTLGMNDDTSDAELMLSYTHKLD
ncbi:MAG: transporter [Gammaproteobacteria bacterium]|nr:transporter [Gammaproteobacteria bacterium]